MGKNKIEIEKDVKKVAISGGNALCTEIDIEGRRKLVYAFAGSINESPKTFSDNCEFNPSPDWSLGSNTRDVERSLRIRKKALGYKELKKVKQCMKGK